MKVSKNMIAVVKLAEQGLVLENQVKRCEHTLARERKP